MTHTKVKEVAPYINMIFMLLITVIGFFVKADFNRRDKVDIALAARLSKVEDNIIANLPHLVEMSKSNSDQIKDIKETRYTNKDAEVKEALISKEFEIVNLKHEVQGEKVKRAEDQLHSLSLKLAKYISER